MKKAIPIISINFVEIMCFPPRNGQLNGLLTSENEELEALFPDYAEYTNKINFGIGKGFSGYLLYLQAFRHQVGGCRRMHNHLDEICS